MNVIIPKPITIPPGSGKIFKSVGVTNKLTGAQTGGAYSLFEVEFEPESGTLLHVHRYEDEIVYVLRGEIEIRLATQRLHALKGGVAYLPKNIPHAFYNPLKTPLKRIHPICFPGFATINGKCLFPLSRIGCDL